MKVYFVKLGPGTYSLKVDLREPIKEKDAVKVTEKSVFLVRGPGYLNAKPIREARSSYYGRYFDSFEEAREFYLKEAKQQLSALEKSVTLAKERIAQYWS